MRRGKIETANVPRFQTSRTSRRTGFHAQSGSRLLEEQGIEMVGGFGPLAGKVFRIGIMGPLVSEDNVNFLLREFKKALNASR